MRNFIKAGVAAQMDEKGCNFSLSSTHAASWLVKAACWQLGLFPVPSLSSGLCHKHTGSASWGNTEPGHCNACVSLTSFVSILCVFYGNLQTTAFGIQLKVSVLIWAP